MALLLGAALSACDAGEVTDGSEDSDNLRPVPTFYDFESRFADTSSVLYRQAVVHHLLIQDLALQIEQLAAGSAAPATAEDLLRRYTFAGDYALRILTPTSPQAAAANYPQIATPASLAELATAPLVSEPLVGRTETADELIRRYLRQIAMQTHVDSLDSAAVYTTEEGIDMRQMIRTLLLGAVPYAQGTGRYLATETLTRATNREPALLGAATEREHAWDMAFGYFGASRYYAGSSDKNLAGGRVYFDADESGAIDFISEYSFTFAADAGARDIGRRDIDFTYELFDAFLRGRTAISNQKAVEDVLAQRDRIREAWEKLLGATAVHYINGALAAMRTVTAQEAAQKSSVALNTSWSAAKGFSFALQYNPARLVSRAELVDLHALLGEAPPYAYPDSSAAADSLRAQLLDARRLLQGAYDFSSGDTAAW